MKSKRGVAAISGGLRRASAVLSRPAAAVAAPPSRLPARNHSTTATTAPTTTATITATTTAAATSVNYSRAPLDRPRIPTQATSTSTSTSSGPISRSLHGQTHPRRSGAPSNPAIQFPCVDALETRSAALLQRQQASRSDESGPEPSYTVGATQTFHCDEPLLLDQGGVLHSFDIAYETWGALNADRSNLILLQTGLSASSHAHSTPENPQPGWWERFIGPGLALDTDKYFIVCTNVIGGCYGSTGPSSIDPSDGQFYATRFPILTIHDMVRAQFRLVDHLGVHRLHAAVGSSMGGMQSLAAAALFPERVGRLVSISACARSHPYSIAMRYVQRRAILNDPNWNRGYYYGRVPPHTGMKLAREIATITYRSGPEWERRFGRRRADPSRPPALCPDFLVETYLDHAGEKFCLTYDPNSLIYVSKAMDLFDLGAENRRATARRRAASSSSPTNTTTASSTTGDACYNLTLPDEPYQEQPESSPLSQLMSSDLGTATNSQGEDPPADLIEGLAPLRNLPVLVMGVASDILFPAWQQREVAEALRRAGNTNVKHVELTEQQSLFGHDTFLLDVENVGGTVKDFLG